MKEAILMNKEISSREFMYIGGVLFFPAILLFKGMLIYYAGALSLCFLLIMFDPIFKYFMKQIKGAKIFICISLISGGGFATISLLLPEYRIGIVLLWAMFYLSYSMGISDKIEKRNKKIMKKYSEKNTIIIKRDTPKE